LGDTLEPAVIDSKDDQLISTRPYLIRAIREWAIDNGLTPQLLVDISAENVVIPPGYAQNDRILLNVDSRAVNSLDLGNDFVSFSTRFGGVSHAVRLTVESILAVLTRENDQGISFHNEENKSQMERDDRSEQQGEERSSKNPTNSSNRPHLYVVE